MRCLTILGLAILGLNLASCGSAPKSFLTEDQELMEMFRANEYARLTDYDRYMIAEYLVGKGQLDNARKIYEDIATYNPRVSAIKFKLALIYLGMDSVSFTMKDEEGNQVVFRKSGQELGEALLNEVLQENARFLPLYSQLMIMNVERQDTQVVSALYSKARELDKNFNAADYRVGYLIMNSKSDADPYGNAKSYMVKARKSYKDLYDSYKNLANIQRVQKQDSIAYKTFIKALETRSEAVDLFSTYYELADVCRHLFKTQDDVHFKEQALKYACLSLQHFPGYQPALDLIESLEPVLVTVDSGLDSIAAREAGIDALCSSMIAEEERVIVTPTSESVIPKSMLRQEAVATSAAAGQETQRSRTKWVVGGAIVLGAGGTVLILSSGGGGGGASGADRPPGFPSVP